MNDPYYDGDFDEPSQDGPLLVRVDPISRARIWTQRLLQRVSLWDPAPLDSAGPDGGYLVDETTPSEVSADIVRWERVFAELPAPHTEPIAYAYSYQFPSGVEIASISTTVTAKVVHEYFRTADPSQIELFTAERYTLQGGVIVRTGTVLPSEYYSGQIGNDMIVAADSELTRWMGRGNIWLRKTPYVPRKTLSEL